MPSNANPSETVATSQHWKHLIQRLDNNELLPHRFRVDALVFLARALAMYKCDALYAAEMKAVRELMFCWIERLLVAQGFARLHVFRRNTAALLLPMMSELEHWVHQELLSRQIGYPLPNAQMSALFGEAFSAVEHVA